MFLLEDGPEAFEVLANIIHANHNQLPNEMTLHLFYETCIFAEKYLMLHVLRDHVSRWYDTMWWNVYRPNGQLEPAEIRERTSVAYMMGDCKAVWAGLTYYAYACRIIGPEVLHWRKGSLILSEETWSENSVLSECRTVLAEEQPFLPDVCFNVIQALRFEVLEEIMGSRAWSGWLDSVFCFREGHHSPACKLDRLSELECEKTVFNQMKAVMTKHSTTGKLTFPLAEDWVRKCQ